MEAKNIFKVPLTSDDQPTFLVTADTKYGSTAFVINPYHAALKYATYVKFVLKRQYSLVCHLDGCYTVQVDGLMPVTYAPESLVSRLIAVN